MNLEPDQEEFSIEKVSYTQIYSGFFQAFTDNLPLYTMKTGRNDPIGFLQAMGKEKAVPAVNPYDERLASQGVMYDKAALRTAEDIDNLYRPMNAQEETEVERSANILVSVETELFEQLYAEPDEVNDDALSDIYRLPSAIYKPKNKNQPFKIKRSIFDGDDLSTYSDENNSSESEYADNFDDDTTLGYNGDVVIEGFYAETVGYGRENENLFYIGTSQGSNQIGMYIDNVLDKLEQDLLEEPISFRQTKTYVTKMQQYGFEGRLDEIWDAVLLASGVHQ